MTFFDKITIKYNFCVISIKRLENNFFDKIYQLSANLYSLLGGILLTISLEIFVNVYAAETLSVRWKELSIASILFFITSISMLNISWILDSLKKASYTNVPETIDPNHIWNNILTPYKATIKRKIYMIFIASIIAMSLLIFTI